MNQNLLGVLWTLVQIIIIQLTDYEQFIIMNIIIGKAKEVWDIVAK